MALTPSTVNWFQDRTNIVLDCYYTGQKPDFRAACTIISIGH
ncbi:hypothetical protein [Acidaminococcus intestini]